MALPILDDDLGIEVLRGPAGDDSPKEATSKVFLEGEDFDISKYAGTPVEFELHDGFSGPVVATANRELSPDGSAIVEWPPVLPEVSSNRMFVRFPELGFRMSLIVQEGVGTFYRASIPESIIDTGGGGGMNNKMMTAGAIGAIAIGAIALEKRR